MDQDLAHRRPFLFASLIFGLTYPLHNLFNMPDLAIIAWKMAAVGSLALYALRNHSHGHFLILASFLAFYALGDGLIQFDPALGAMAFAIGHLIAIYFFAQYKRSLLTLSQKILVLILPIIIPIISLLLIKSPDDSGYQAAIFMFLMSAMVAMSWASSFTRYRVGVGAILFLVSDLLFFWRMGMNAEISWLNHIIWYSYYVGIFLIATGIVQTLRKKGS